MIDKQEILIRLACAALQGGMDPDDVSDGVAEEGDLWFVAQTIYPDSFDVDTSYLDEDGNVTNTKNKY